MQGTRHFIPAVCFETIINQLNNNCSKGQTAKLSMANQNHQVVVIANHRLEEELKMYRQRATTQLPYCQIQEAFVTERDSIRAVIQVSVRGQLTSIDQFAPLGLSDIVYVLKETSLGYERLLKRFGPFQLSKKMIMIDEHNKCRIWINSNPAINQVERPALELTEDQLLKKFIKFFQELVKMTDPQCLALLATLSSCSNFCQVMRTLDDFAHNNKINSPSLMRHLKKNISSTSYIQAIAANETNRKYPSFLKGARSPDRRGLEGSIVRQESNSYHHSRHHQSPKKAVNLLRKHLAQPEATEKRQFSYQKRFEQGSRSAVELKRKVGSLSFDLPRAAVYPSSASYSSFSFLHQSQKIAESKLSPRNNATMKADSQTTEETVFSRHNEKERKNYVSP